MGGDRLLSDDPSSDEPEVDYEAVAGLARGALRTLTEQGYL